jgi:membrane protein DedA with SNARE-associated domain
MTETLLALVPTWGLWLVLLALPLSCLALPVPSSIIVMAAGGFAAAGDMVLWQVQAAAFAGFVAGDQLVYGIARSGGAPLLDRMKGGARMGPVFVRAEGLLQTRGPVAVFLSRTVLSPVGPYVGYLSGAMRLRWLAFTLAAVAGAAIWAISYSLLGYVFATRITQVASLIGNGLGVVLGATAVAALVWYLWHSFKAERGALP